MREGNRRPGDRLSRRDALRLLGVAGLAASCGASGVANDRPSSEGAMTTRRIPASGEALPVVGLGTWQTFDVGPTAAERAPLAEVLRAFAAAGARVVDSSPMYGEAEGVVGDLARDLGVGGSLFFATKVWTPGREAGVAQMERSMRRFGVERVDLMQVHNLVDVETHLETLAAWKAAGRVRYVGVTHYLESAFGQLERLVASRPLDFVQLNFSIGDRAAERRLLPAAAERGVAVLVNQPFGSGSLFERVRGRALPEWAADLGCASWAQYFLKFIVGHPAVTCAIPATSKARHLVDNLGAGRGALPDERMRRRMAEHFDAL
jgi:diketogulonate reductase-like aldo/keto reductase